MSNNLRIRTTVNSGDKYIKFKLDQTFDNLEILSLKLSQDKVYQTFCSDYGVVVGRVIVNNGFGVPNAKVSIFIPISEEDKLNTELYNLYPYSKVTDKNQDGLRYNLLPKENGTNDNCYTPVGSFPSKREILDNELMLEIYDKYYKYTTVTNESGDYMIFGVPLGTYTIHIDVDISDIGVISQKPYDLIDQGTPTKYFNSPTKFKSGKNLNTLVQVKTLDTSVVIKPFWGDLDKCEIGINRIDFDLNYTVRPTAFFVGSAFGDSRKNSVNKQCRPRKDLGSLCEQVTGEGTIEMIRKTIDNEIEEYSVDGGRVIDENGAWAYQIPMNLDYVITDEFGNLIPSNDQSKGIPTRARVRFRIGLDESGSVGRLRTKGKYLVPNNPKDLSGLDFNFDSNTKDESFVDLYWNKIYTVKNYISRVQKRSAGPKSNNFVGIKDVDNCVGEKNPFPYNRASTRSNVLFTLVCLIVSIVTTILSVLNGIICTLKNISIFGFKPFKFLNPISVPCPTDPVTNYSPGCGSKVEDYVDCLISVIADDLNLYRLDFYNDWVNGSLYLYQLKYKRKRKSGREKFCETNCNDYNGGTGNNDCKNNELLDTTVTGESDNYTRSFRNGLLVKFKDQLYYPPILLNGSNMKMYATDIVNLGSIIDCDWQGLPKIIQYFDGTSYNIPPLIQENDDNIVTSGMMEIGTKYKGLFFSPSCVGLKYNATKATNIRRQCEIGVDIPETTNGLAKTTITIEEIYDINDPTDIDVNPNRFLRDNFYLLNINGSEITSLPQNPNLKIPSQSTSFGYFGSSSMEIHRDGEAYLAFRNYQFQHPNEALDMSFQSWGNSYYMYFGLVEGKTGIDKFKSKYLTTCQPYVNEDFIVNTTIINSTTNINDGIVYFEILGGKSPYTYQLTSNNFDSGEVKITDNNGSIENLQPNEYTLRITDSLGFFVEKSIIVEGPMDLKCGYSVYTQPTNTNSFDGSISIDQLVGGQGPYTIEISGPNFSTIINNATILNSPINYVPEGTYTITTTDSSQPIQICEKTVTLNGSPKLSLNVVNVQNVGCNGDCDGNIDLSISGGKKPVTISVTGPNGYSTVGDFDTTKLDGLCEGTYGIQIIDSSSQKDIKTVTLTRLDAPSINTNNINNIKQCSTTQYTVKFNLVGSSNKTYNVIYNVDGSESTQSAVIGLNTLVITQQINQYLTINVVDNNGCTSNVLVFDSNILKRPSATLTLGGTRVGNKVTYSATGGLTPYTYTPVDSGNDTVYNAPSSSPVIGTVTDIVGCTATNTF